MQSAQFQLNARIEEVHWWFAGRRRILGELIRRVVPTSGRPTIVDVGCGTGANIASMAADYDCVGIDTSAEAIGLARRRFPGPRFVCGQAPDDLGPAMARARLVLLTDVLEHVRDDFAMLSRLLAASTPGTHFLITVPADASLWSEHDVSHGHYRRYDEDRLRRAWDGLPVTTRMLSHFNARLRPIVGAVRARGRRRGRAAGLDGTDLRLPSGPINVALRTILAGERRVLVDLLEGRRRRGYSSGVSLVALLRREEGTIVPRSRPDDLPPDLHDPDAYRTIPDPTPQQDARRPIPCRGSSS